MGNNITPTVSSIGKVVTLKDTVFCEHMERATHKYEILNALDELNRLVIVRLCPTCFKKWNEKWK